jgi:sterol 3beta-glucosyltransferase
MRYCLVTYGSRGDVQPFIHLALGLNAKGHQATLAGPSNFQELVAGYGIDFYPLFGDAEEIVRSPECRKVIKTGSNIAFARMALRKMRDKRLQILADIHEACKSADVIISINPCIFYVATVAEKLNKKWLLVQLNPPMIPTREFPMLLFNFPDVSWLNRHTYSLVNNILWLAQKEEYSLFRQTLGLPPYNGSLFDKVTEERVPMIHAFSSELITRPADWPEPYTIAGFFTRSQTENEQSKLALGLKKWMQAGDKPLYIGFGSIPFPDKRKLSIGIKELLEKTDIRIIYCRGWSDMPDLPENPRLLIIEQADHAWLLPKCRAAVIHGGIGTIAAVLQAGIPAIVASLFVDQPAWGKIIEQRKLGVHIPWKKLSATTVLDALTRVEQEPIKTSLQQAHARLLKENGVEAAIVSIEAV